MTKDRLLTFGTGIVLFLYPVLIYFGVQHFSVRSLAVILLVMAAIRFLTTKNERTISIYGIAAIVVIAIVALMSDSSSSLYFYPLLINGVLFCIFFLSLFNPPSIIERIARRTNPELPKHAIGYTRKVTQAWCVFFILNGIASVITLYQSEQWWLIYNGLIAYGLIALMLGGEYLIRIHVMRKHNA